MANPIIRAEVETYDIDLFLKEERQAKRTRTLLTYALAIAAAVGVYVILPL